MGFVLMADPQTAAGPANDPQTYFLLDTLKNVTSESIPSATLAWLQYEQSITKTAEYLTQQTCIVQNRKQELSAAPPWLPSQYQQNTCTFTRKIELMAGTQQILLAGTYTHPNGDVVKALEELGDKPLANLLFSKTANYSTHCNYVKSGSGYGRVVEWQIASCTHPLLLVELFDPNFVHLYSPTSADI